MSITEIGIEGEQKARKIILEYIKPQIITQMDWFYNKDDKWYSVEVKQKERFTPPPFEGHGLNIRQVRYRMRFYKDTGIRCLFLVFEKDLIFEQWLDILERTTYFDTKNGVRIYNLKHFKTKKINLLPKE